MKQESEKAENHSKGSAQDNYEKMLVNDCIDALNLQLQDLTLLSECFKPIKNSPLVPMIKLEILPRNQIPEKCKKKAKKKKDEPVDEDSDIAAVQKVGLLRPENTGQFSFSGLSGNLSRKRAFPVFSITTSESNEKCSVMGTPNTPGLGRTSIQIPETDSTKEKNIQKWKAKHDTELIINITKICINQPLGILSNEHNFQWVRKGIRGNFLNPLIIYPSIKSAEDCLSKLVRDAFRKVKRLKQIRAPIRYLNFKNNKEEDLFLLENTTRKGEILARNVKAVYKEGIEEIKLIIRESTFGSYAMLAIIRQFEYILNERSIKYLKIIEEGLIKKHHFNIGCKEIGLLLKDKRYLEDFLPNNLLIGIFYIDLTLVKSHLIKTLDKNLFAIFDCNLSIIYIYIYIYMYIYIYIVIQIAFFMTVEDINRKVSNVTDKLNNKILDLKAFLDLKVYIMSGEVDDDIDEIVQGRESCSYLLKEIDKYQLKLNTEKGINAWFRYFQSEKWIMEVNKLKLAAIKQIKRVAPKYQYVVKEETELLISAIESTDREINQFLLYSDTSKAFNYICIANGIIEDDIIKFHNQAADINDYQRILEVPITSFDMLATMNSRIKPLEVLWNLKFQWIEKYENKWLPNKFIEINDTDCSDFIAKSRVKIEKLEEEDIISKNIIPARLLTLIEREITYFSDNYLPFILKLKDISFEGRHWGELKNLLVKKRKWEEKNDLRETITLKDFMEMNILEEWDEIQEITLEAIRQYEIKKKMEEIDLDLRNSELEFIPHPENPNLFLLKGALDIMSKFDNHNFTSKLLLKSDKYSEPFKGHIEEIRKLLKMIKKILSMIHEIQQDWSFAYEIFRIKDYQMILPKQYSDFENIHEQFIIYMNLLSKNSLSNFCSKDKLVPFEKMEKELKNIKHKIRTDILAAKRRNFPRFYYISDFHLLQIFCNQTNIGVLSDHIGQCFRGITELLTDSNERIIGVSDSGNDTLYFDSPIPIFKKGAPIPIEEWLIPMEKEISGSLKQNILDSIIYIKEEGISSTIGNNKLCVQAITIGLQIMFCYNIQSYHTHRGLPGLIICAKLLKEMITEAVELLKVKKNRVGGEFKMDILKKDSEGGVKKQITILKKEKSGDLSSSGYSASSSSESDIDSPKKDRSDIAEFDTIQSEEELSVIDQNSYTRFRIGSIYITLKSQLELVEEIIGIIYIYIYIIASNPSEMITSYTWDIFMKYRIQWIWGQYQFKGEESSEHSGSEEDQEEGDNTVNFFETGLLLRPEVDNRAYYNSEFMRNVSPDEDITFFASKDFNYLKKGEKFGIVACSLHFHEEFGFEFYGSEGGLTVYTPNLARALYLTMSALCSNLFCLYTGVPGIGKIETVKAASKALGQPLVIFPCRGGTNHDSIRRCIEGAVLGGFYVLIDELKHLQINLISTLAQQVIIIPCTDYIYI